MARKTMRHGHSKSLPLGSLVGRMHGSLHIPQMIDYLVPTSKPCSSFWNVTTNASDKRQALSFHAAAINNALQSARFITGCFKTVANRMSDLAYFFSHEKFRRHSLATCH